MKSLLKILNFIWNHPIGSKRKIKSFSRFFYFQLSSRIYRKKQKFSFVNYSHLLVGKGLHGLTGNVYVGLAEFQDMSFLLHFLNANDIFCDVGANAGSYTVLASSVVGCRSIAFEPLPSTFKHLKDNIEINHITTLVDARNIGVGENESVLNFTSDMDTVNHVVLDLNKPNIHSVQVNSLDNLRLPEIALMKIDVEGFELPVLKGAVKLLESNNLKAIIIEMNGSGNRYGFPDEDVDKLLRKHGFLSYKYIAFERELTEIQSFNRHENTLYLKDIEFIQKRIKESDSFKVFGLKI